MTDPARNAAIYYADDGYDPAKGGINGRRVAGASFLGGFFRHAQADRFVSITNRQGEIDAFAAQLRAAGRTEEHRNFRRELVAKAAPVATLYYPSANIGEECWRRQIHGAAAYAVCGITHTTATQAIMKGIFDLRAAPQMPWDALICTSRAVHASTLRNMEIADDALRARFGGTAPRPLMPVIPLGIDTASFAPDPAASAAFRDRMGWGEADVALVTLSRLLPYGKFDPGPFFTALQAAQDRLTGLRLHFVACGIYSDDYSRRAFDDCARALMPGVSFTHLDGADPSARKEALSGGDIFAFPIDNVQETFGLAPVEAMAAGLPVIASDWNGIRDTVTPECGVLIPTRTVRAAASRPEGDGYHGGRMSYAQYGSNLSALTALDMGRMIEGIVALAGDADLRRRMGAAGQSRAQSLFDWAAVIPQYQDLWAEQTRLRRGALARETSLPTANPLGPLPFDLFASYPSEGQGLPGLLVAEPAATVERLTAILTARRFAKLGNAFEAPRTLQTVLERIMRAGEDGLAVADVAAAQGWNALSVERAAMFLLKYGLVSLR